MANFGLKLKGDVRTDDDFIAQLKLLRPSCTELNTSLTISSASFIKQNGQIVRAYVNNKSPSTFTGDTIDLASYTGSVPANNYVKALVTIDPNDDIVVHLGIPSVALVTATEPTSPNYPIALLNLFKNGSSVLQPITNSAIEDRRPINQTALAPEIPQSYEMISEQYLVQIADEFIALPNDEENSIDFGTNQTSLTQVVNGATKNLMLMHYSTRSATISGNVNIVLASAPSFTVRVNCWVRVGSDFARITSVTDQQNFSVASPGFSNGPATAVILEPVITKDLYNDVGSAAQGTRVIDTFSDNVDNILVDYDDSLAANDFVFDGGTPNVICLASTSDVDQFITSLRPSSKNGYIEDISVGPAATNLRLVFVPNTTVGDGTVNLLGYACMFLRDPDIYRGGIFNQAYGFTDDVSGLNCTFGIAGGKTIINLNGGFSSYVPGVNPNSPYGDIIVKDAGVEIPRKTVGVTDDALPHYTESAANQITLWGQFDTPATRRQISVIRRFGTKDTSDDNALFLANFNFNGFNFATYVVGSALQVTQGLAHYSSIQAAHDALPGTGGKLYVLAGTYTENLTLSKSVVIEGTGRQTVVDGTATLASGATYSVLKDMRFVDNITINADACFVNEIWMAPTKIVVDSGVGNDVNYIIE